MLIGFSSKLGAPGRRWHLEDDLMRLRGCWTGSTYAIATHQHPINVFQGEKKHVQTASCMRVRWFIRCVFFSSPTSCFIVYVSALPYVKRWAEKGWKRNKLHIFHRTSLTYSSDLHLWHAHTHTHTVGQGWMLASCTNESGGSFCIKVAWKWKNVERCTTRVCTETTSSFTKRPWNANQTHLFLLTFVWKTRKDLAERIMIKQYLIFPLITISLLESSYTIN